MEYGVDKAFDGQNSPYSTATDGWDGLEAQVARHAFDGELGAGYGMDHGERAVDHIVSDTQKYSSTRHTLPQMCKAPRERMLARRLGAWTFI